jgi:ubiquinone/menaquinone biosynthesis C-methylase UbiE
LERTNHTYPDFQYVQQNAQDLSQFKDNEFDLAVSIGLLGHVIEEKSFKKIVLEIRRVAKQHIVMVPAKICSIEPHYGFPFFPLFPYSI